MSKNKSTDVKDVVFKNPQDPKLCKLRNKVQNFLEDHRDELNKKEVGAFNLVRSVITDMSWEDE